jgi:RNA polymerase sigma-54 factor
MALSPRIELRQSPSLVMTPQLQQAIKLLQMNNLALAEFVAAEVERNPLLDYAAPPTSVPAPRITASGAAAPDDGLDAIEAPVSLAGHLHAQIGAARADAAAVAAAHLLAEELEEDGYLRAPLPEVALRHRLGAGEALRGLALLQGCDPTGVGARSLRECLELQLRERDRLDPAMRALLDNLALMARGRTAELRALCGVDAEDFADMLAELRALDPKPGLRFARPAVQVAAPDVYVTPAPGGGWTVELNAETLPRVLVNNRYAARVSGADAAARRYISEMSLAANWLVRSLEQRARTILKVAGELTRHQEGFFAGGPRRLRPLTQRALADRLGLHESTVSRVTSGKHLTCAQGTLPLRYFFSASIQAAGDGEAVSAIAVQDRIRLLVGREPGGRPLSDDRIVAVLHGEGIDVARRTVAKYREVLGIPSSVERRRRNAVLSGV